MNSAHWPTESCLVWKWLLCELNFITIIDNRQWTFFCTQFLLKFHQCDYTWSWISCEICMWKSFTLTQNSHSHRFLLKWLDFADKNCTNNCKRDCILRCWREPLKMFCFILYFILGFLKFYFKIILFNFIWVLDPIEKKIFFCVPKKIIQVWNNMTVSKWHLLKVFQNLKNCHWLP